MSPCSQNSDVYSPEGVAISPDGKDVYVVENYYGGITQFRRDASGALAFASCVNATGANACSSFAPLSGATGAVVSPDGKQVYVATSNGALVTLDRNAASGALTPDAGAPCVSEPSANGCPAGHGMTSLATIAISPDGSTVYTGSSSVGVAAFSRNQATGALSEITCIDSGGTDTCSTGDAMDDVEGIAISADGKYLYTADRAGFNLGVLSFNGSAFSQLQCFVDGSIGSPPAGCTAEQAVAAPTRIALVQGQSGVGSVYATDYSGGGDTTEWLRNPATGLLTYVGCRSRTGSVGSYGGVCVADGVQWGALGVAASPDGQTVYTLGERSNPVQGSQSIQAYRRDTGTGLLTPIAGSCLSGASPPLSGCTGANAMYDPYALAVSPDGAFVEVVSRGNGGVATFSAEVAPVCQPVTASTTDPAAAGITLSCSDANGDPLTLNVASVPSHGTVSAVSGSSVIYTPATGFSGSDSFTYTASDGTLSAPAATVTVSVAPQPQSQPQPQPKPALSGAHLTHPRFRLGTAATGKTKGKRRFAPKGTSFVFTLSQAASVKITITTAAPGLRSGGRCVAPTRKLRSHHAKRCTRTVTIGSITRSEGEGADRVAFSGRLGRKALKPGRYLATLTATSAAGSSTAVTLKFSVVN